MDVILVFPQTGPKKTVWVPLSLLYLAEALRENGFSTQIIDARIEKTMSQDLRTFLKKIVFLAFQ